MPPEAGEATRWQAGIAHATAAGTVPWQHASLATGLVGLGLVVTRGAEASPAAWLALSLLQAGLLAGGLWLSLRLRIDAALFHALAQADGTDGFDQAMLDLRLIDARKAGRPMADRVAGLMRLVRRLALVVAAQLALLVAAGWFAWR